MSKRKFKTAAERIADSKKSQVRTVLAVLIKALGNVRLAAGWLERAEELIEKAEGARAVALKELTDIGIEKDQALALLSDEADEAMFLDVLSSFGVTLKDLIDAKILVPAEEA